MLLPGHASGSSALNPLAIMIKYDNTTVRRQDRLLDADEAVQLLRDGEYGVLSMQAEDGGGYGAPLSYVWDGAEHIYIHCAPEGRKLRCIDLNPSASFCIVGATRLLPSKFTTEYTSLILRCHARRNLPPEERMRALELLLDKYSPADKAMGLKYAAGSFHRAEIIRLDIIEVSGKRKSTVK